MQKSDTAAEKFNRRKKAPDGWSGWGSGVDFYSGSGLSFRLFFQMHLQVWIDL